MSDVSDEGATRMPATCPQQVVRACQVRVIWRTTPQMKFLATPLIASLSSLLAHLSPYTWITGRMVHNE